MLSKIIQSKVLVFVLLCSFVSLIVTEVMPFEKKAAEIKKSTPVVKVKVYGKKISSAQKKNFEQIIAEGRRLFLDEMDYEGAIARFKEAEELAVTQPQKSDAYFWLSLVYYATIAERGEEDFKEIVRRLIEVDYYRELDLQLSPRNYLNLFQEIKAEYGVLKVQSRPSEAEVFLDEKEDSSGKTPFTIGIKAGSIDIKVKKGSKEKKDTLKVEAGKTTTSPIYVLKGKSGLLFVLGGIALAGGAGVALLGKKSSNGGGTPSGSTTGSIQVNSTPTGAKVYLDGTDTGKTTNTTLTNISPGNHTVKLIKEGYKNTEQSVSVTEGQTANVNISLSQHTITVTSPSSSTIWATGTEVEITWTYDETSKTLGNINSNAWLNYRLHQGNSMSPDIKNRIVRNNPSSKGTYNSREKFDGTHTSRNREELLKESIQDRKSLSMNVVEKEHVNLNIVRSIELIDTSRNLNLPISPKTSINFSNPSIQGSKTDDDIKILILTNIKIELFRGSNLIETVASSTENNGTHKWTVPSSLSDGSDYKVRISSTSAPSVFGESSQFKIESNPTTGSIQVNSTPTGASIYLDGADTGKTTNATLTNISPGSHTVMLAKEGYEDYEETVNVTAGQTTTINATLIQIVEDSYQFITKWGSGGSGDGQFSQPVGIAVDGAGNLYVADNNNNRVQKFTSAGTFITKWGSVGSNIGEFNGVDGIAVGPDGFVYTAENENNRIQKFTSEGTFVTQWGGGPGSEGIGDGEFNSPRGIDVSNDNFIYVADRLNHRIQKFTSDGTFVAKWGSLGSGNNQFNEPYDVAVDGAGNVYVTDNGNNRAQKFTSAGTYITQWKINNGASHATGIDANNTGDIFVVDNENSEINKFTNNGEFITKWGSIGSGNGQFSWPEGISVNNTGNVYVADTQNNRIQEFGPVSSAVQTFKSSPNFIRNNILNRNIGPRPRNLDLPRQDNAKGEVNLTQRENRKQKK